MQSMLSAKGVEVCARRRERGTVALPDRVNVHAVNTSGDASDFDRDPNLAVNGLHERSGAKCVPIAAADDGESTLFVGIGCRSEKEAGAG